MAFCYQALYLPVSGFYRRNDLQAPDAIHGIPFMLDNLSAGFSIRAYAEELETAINVGREGGYQPGPGTQKAVVYTQTSYFLGTGSIPVSRVLPESLMKMYEIVDGTMEIDEDEKRLEVHIDARDRTNPFIVWSPNSGTMEYTASPRYIVDACGLPAFVITRLPHVHPDVHRLGSRVGNWFTDMGYAQEATYRYLFRDEAAEPDSSNVIEMVHYQAGLLFGAFAWEESIPEETMREWEASTRR